MTDQERIEKLEAGVKQLRAEILQMRNGNLAMADGLDAVLLGLRTTRNCLKLGDIEAADKNIAHIAAQIAQGQAIIRNQPPPPWAAN
jgi:hypothetical protein